MKGYNVFLIYIFTKSEIFVSVLTEYVGKELFAKALGIFAVEAIVRAKCVMN